MDAKVNPSLYLELSSDAAMHPFMDTPGKRVRWALKQRRRTAAWLAKELGITRGAVSQWWSEKHPSTPRDHISEIATLLEYNEKWLRDGAGSPEARELTSQVLSQTVPFSTEAGENKDTVYTVGEVGAGMWLMVDELSDLSFSREASAFPTDTNYPAAKQYDLIVRGTSIDCFAADGERVRCVNLDATDLVHGDYVHVQRYSEQRSRIENTIKRAFNVAGRWELRFHSNDPRWEGQPPLILGSGETEQVEIMGIALWKFRPSPVRSRR